MRLVLLTYDLPEANRVVGRLLDEFGADVAGIVTSSVPVAGRGAWSGATHLVRRCGVGLPTWITWHRFVGRVASGFGRITGRPVPTGSLRGLARRAGVPLVATNRVNDDRTRETIAGWRPDLLVSIYHNQKVRPRTARLATRGAINFHPALLPRNRGLLPCFWTLANGDREAGVSVHWIDEELDTGDVITSRTVPVEPHDSLATLAHRCSRIGGDVLVDCIRRIERDEVETESQDHGRATYYGWPTRSALKRFRRRGHTFGSLRSMWTALRDAA